MVGQKNLTLRRLQTGFARAKEIQSLVNGDWSKTIHVLKEAGLGDVDLALAGWPIRLIVQSGKVKAENTKTPAVALAGLLLRTLYDVKEKGAKSSLVVGEELVEPSLKESTLPEYKKWLQAVFPNVSLEYIEFLIGQYH